MPWTYENPPAVAENWTEEEQRRCVDAANAVIEETGDDEQAIFACIRAAGKEGGKMKNKKTFRGPLEWKADADTTGQFTAAFATLGVVDHDGDVTVKGAFEEGQEAVIEPWNHNYGAPPVGKGVIRVDGDKALVDGKFFLETPAGLEHYRVVKALGDMQEWSYTYSIEEQSFGKFEEREVRFLRKLDVWGIAPVQRGAGIDTFTVGLKGAKAALASHSTATSDVGWDGPANGARVRSGENEAYYRRIFAWMDPEGDPTVKATYRFIHHEVSGDGAPGAANVRACTSAIGVLNGGRGGTTIPDADRQGVWNHLARHLRDAEVEPPELKAAGLSARDGEGEPDGETGDGKPSGLRPSTVRVRAEVDLVELGS